MIQLFNKTVVDEMNSDTPRLIMAVEILYKSNPVRAHSGTGEIIINGQSYIGVGNLGNISPIEQSSNTGTSSITITMSGLDPTLVAETLNERTQGCKVKVMICSFDESYSVTSAAIVFSGRISSQRYSYGMESSIEIECVDRFADWQRKGALRFDDTSHQAMFDGDEFFVYTPQMSEMPVYWGSKKDAPPMSYGK